MADINVYLYPNTSSADYLADAAYTALSDALDDVITYTPGDSLGTYSITTKYDHPNLSDPDRSTFKSNFEDWAWLETSGTGCHLGISTNFNGGLADSGEWDENAFATETEAVVGSSTGDGAHYRNVAIQETFHPFIDSSISSVKSMLGPDNNEHSLGEIDYNADTTPMVTTYYDKGYASNGGCGHSVNPDGKTTAPTNCTCEAFEISFNTRG
ncbi:hypothetical protein M0R88_14955 [Halorussus gelatinilyticus]|uniref:Uncharacterized protein n=1 Tax=Halorussus gelatinilyticus TaxID=2937524 RepID=A0A8U0IGJ4_9EURY|nr:hypothetical protein [Halorussus gelatinilyticus]UPV99805.1 hypothetical protein M0R88_14955 [Halorussus gelatinilyticus]